MGKTDESYDQVVEFVGKVAQLALLSDDEALKAVTILSNRLLIEQAQLVCQLRTVLVEALDKLVEFAAPDDPTLQSILLEIKEL